MENFTRLQAYRKRGKSARASPTPNHKLNEERRARFTAQALSALMQCYRARCIEHGKEDEFFNVSDLFAVAVFP